MKNYQKYIKASDWSPNNRSNETVILTSFIKIIIINIYVYTCPIIMQKFTNKGF